MPSCKGKLCVYVIVTVRETRETVFDWIKLKSPWKNRQEIPECDMYIVSVVSVYFRDNSLVATLQNHQWFITRYLTAPQVADRRPSEQAERSASAVRKDQNKVGVLKIRN